MLCTKSAVFNPVTYCWYVSSFPETFFSRFTRTVDGAKGARDFPKHTERHPLGECAADAWKAPLRITTDSIPGKADFVSKSTCQSHLKSDFLFCTTCTNSVALPALCYPNRYTLRKNIKNSAVGEWKTCSEKSKTKGAKSLRIQHTLALNKNFH